jgi:hypothetical protein
MTTGTAILDIETDLNQWLEEIAKKEAPARGCAEELDEDPQAMRRRRETVEHDQGPDGSNPLPNEDATVRGRRDGTARARLQSHSRHKHRGTGPSDCSDPNIGCSAETVPWCHERDIGGDSLQPRYRGSRRMVLHDQDPFRLLLVELRHVKTDMIPSRRSSGSGRRERRAAPYHNTIQRDRGHDR